MVEKHHGAHLFTPPRFQDPRAKSEGDSTTEADSESIVDDLSTFFFGRTSTSVAANPAMGDGGNGGGGDSRSAAEPAHADTDAAAPTPVPKSADRRALQELPLADAGFEFNFPLPPLLREDRSVDIHVVFDFTA